MSDHEERDPYGETQSAPDPFDAFRARREQERAEQEQFAVLPESEPDAQEYAAALPPLAPPPPPPAHEQYTQLAPPPFDETAPRAPRRRLRSAIVFGGVAALVIGVGAGVWAATSSSGGSPAAAPAGTPSASAPASPGAKATKGKAVTARLTVTSVGSDSFSATTVRGETVVVHITSATRFGTAARPFTRAQLVPGAEIFARLRKETDGTVVATVIASTTATQSAEPSAAASSAGT